MPLLLSAVAATIRKLQLQKNIRRRKVHFAETKFCCYNSRIVAANGQWYFTAIQSRLQHILWP